MICPGEEHARNKEIDLVTKKGQLNVLRISLLISYILIKEISLRKLILLSNHVKHNNNNNIYIIFLPLFDIPNGLREVSNIAQQ